MTLQRKCFSVFGCMVILGKVIWFHGEEKKNDVTKRMFLYIWLHVYFMVK